MNWATRHPFFDIVLFWVFSAVVGGMPEPAAGTSSGYLWAYNSLHILAGNLKTAFAAKFPNIPEGTTVQQTTQTVITKDTPQ